MARADFDIATILGFQEMTGPFHLYTEVAVLGVKNQPVYYENVKNRIPVMLGVHLPTFNLPILDMLAFETEYLDNPYQDSQRNLSGGSDSPLEGYPSAVPDMEKEDYSRAKFRLPSVHNDDWKWTAYVVLNLIQGVKLKVQMANDHMRLFDYNPLRDAEPETRGKGDWYYMAHLQWGL
jgi:hypothetical protein